MLQAQIFASLHSPSSTLALPLPNSPSPTPTRKLAALFRRGPKPSRSTERTALAQGVGSINTNDSPSYSPATTLTSTPRIPQPPLPAQPSPPSDHPSFVMLSAHHPQTTHLHQPPPPPTKASLKTWWNHFTFVQRAKKDSHSYIREYEKGASSSNTTTAPQSTDAHPSGSPSDHPVFGKPLVESLKYASVPISTANQNGDLYVWGYVPVVVAKCGLHLKEKATEVPGTFRVNGSNKRMRELQLVFETPPKYGKNLDWKQETYTSHDVASVFRRYLTQMPEPVIPHRLYHKFRDALAREPHNQDAVIAEYKSLIRQMPQAHQYLLLYVLDLLSVFSRKSDKNLMTAQNLAVIFRPGILSHPSHEMLPHEHALSQRVLEFLIAHQDWFMLDTPAPNPSQVSPPLPSNAGPASSDHARYPTHRTAPRLPDGEVGLGLGFRRQGVDSEDERERAWRSAGIPMTREEIEREQERIKMMRRRTTLERGEATMYGTLEEGDMGGGDSPTIASPIFSLGGAVGVTRSRTLPSSRRRPGVDPGASGSNPNVNVSAGVTVPEKEKSERSRLTKKQKRASMATPQTYAHTQQQQTQTYHRTSQMVSPSTGVGHVQFGSA
ncbi:Rho GTPase activation protein [Macrolepiota fuliginosa MF-IS2]|uniref:Rho GTPase activation protein n=1 Tax=Macrolepiota fuliginosa MF-IS2 TaxID=1400762 RepID=A0A9P5XLS2_9AGAR|nr:Rho GTPase activation protein [Macrolepiota fuliginosa MF-IS2]